MVRARRPSKAAEDAGAAPPPAAPVASPPTAPPPGGSQMAGAVLSPGAASAAASAASSPPLGPPRPSSGLPPTDEAVLAYLKKRGLGGAAVELSRQLRAEKRRKEQEGGSDGGGDVDAAGAEMEIDEARARAQRTAIGMSTGGGLGYELDAAPVVGLWACGSREGEEVEELVMAASASASASAAQLSSGTIGQDKTPVTEEEKRGQEEARRYVRAFTALQTWVLHLPDDGPGAPSGPTATVASVLAAARNAASRASASGGSERAESEEEGGGDGEKGEKEVHVIPEPGEAAQAAKASASAPAAAALASSQQSGQHRPYYSTSPHAAPSSKPELLSVTFALFVSTYAELLECGLEHTAAALLATYRHVYEPSHQAELADLDLCRTTEHIVELNTNSSGHAEMVTELRNARAQAHNLRKKKASFLHQQSKQQQQQQQQQQNARQVASIVAALDAEIHKYEEKFHEANRRLQELSTKLANLPFLRRARWLRWQLALSATSHQLLAAYLGRGDSTLLPMASLLTNRCFIDVQAREPLPCVPTVILEDMILGDEGDGAGGALKGDGKEEGCGGLSSVRWAAPIHPTARAAEGGDDLRVDDERSILARAEPLPFPKFYVDGPEDGSGATAQEAADAKARVEFNRALLINGFRRLEALECKEGHESGMRAPASSLRRPFASATEGKVAPSGAAVVEDEDEADDYREFADPHSPSVLLSTLCAVRPSSGPSWSYGIAATEGGGAVGSTLLQESGIDICCAKLCPPDGRRVAAGCDDAAVRIWTLGGEGTGASSASGAGANGSKKGIIDTAPSDGASKPEESSLVMLGHKNGFPVFDLDWNRDGRTLLSAGGDGSIRLWDTAAVGTFGRLSNVVKKTHSSNASSSKIDSTELDSIPRTTVSGSKPEPMVELSGAAIAAYRGHSPFVPIWSVEFAPSGYYFASAGWDSTARIWTTDRPNPVRILAGHFSSSVNCIAWHPNANYVLTAADDKTARMWDIQTGKCVRLLNGAGAGLNGVKVCPTGRYAAASDYGGTVHIWDLGSGRKVNELRHTVGGGGGGTAAAAVQSMSYSACGTALATGGDDCTVRIWDVRGAGSHLSNPEYAKSQGYGESSALSASLPSESQLARRPIGERFRYGAREPVNMFRTRRTVLLDLHYTKRNLLLGCGKVVGKGG